jgi:hypothetical protein
LNLFRVGAFLNCGLNFFHDLIVEGKKECANNSPLYLYDCLLPFIREENELNLRNQTEFRNPFTRLQLFAHSFFPSTIKSWNKLSPQLRNAPTLNRFKQVFLLILDFMIIVLLLVGYYATCNAYFIKPIYIN